MRHVVWFIGLFFFTPMAQAQFSCGSIFADGLSISIGEFTAEKQNSVAGVEELTAKILSMSAQTLSESFNPKTTSEKGKIILGQRIEEGWSVEMEYVQDLRSSEIRFHLADLGLVKPNGEKVKFGKYPSLDGLSFNQSHFTAREMLLPESPHPFQIIRHIEAPAVISGKLLESLDRWLPYVEYLRRSDLRHLQKEDLAKLKTKAVLASNWDFTKKIIRKQSYKFALLGAAMYLYTARPTLDNVMLSSGEAWEAALGNSHFYSLNSHEYNYLVGQLQELLQTPADQMDIETTSKKTRISEKSYLDLSGVLKVTRDLFSEERKYDLKNEIYLFSNGKITDLSMKKISNLLNSDTEMSILLMFYSPVSKRVFFVAPDLAMGESELKFFTFAADAESHPTLLNLIKSRLSERKAE